MIRTMPPIKPEGGDFSKARRFRSTTLPLPLEHLEGHPPGHPDWVRTCAWYQALAREHGATVPARFLCRIDPSWDVYGIDNVRRAASVACSERFGAH